MQNSQPFHADFAMFVCLHTDVYITMQTRPFSFNADFARGLLALMQTSCEVCIEKVYLSSTPWDTTYKFFLSLSPFRSLSLSLSLSLTLSLPLSFLLSPFCLFPLSLSFALLRSRLYLSPSLSSLSLSLSLVPKPNAMSRNITSQPNTNVNTTSIAPRICTCHVFRCVCIQKCNVLRCVRA